MKCDGRRSSKLCLSKWNTRQAVQMKTRPRIYKSKWKTHTYINPTDSHTRTPQQHVSIHEVISHIQTHILNTHTGRLYPNVRYFLIDGVFGKWGCAAAAACASPAPAPPPGPPRGRTDHPSGQPSVSAQGALPSIMGGRERAEKEKLAVGI